MWRRRLALLAASCATLAAPAVAAPAVEPPPVEAPAGAAPPVPAEDAFELRYEDDLLTVRLDGVPLDVVVDKLRATTGVEFRGELRDWREVTKHFDGVPLPEALDRILGRQNFAVRYDAEGHPAVVELYGMPQSRVTSKAGGAPVTNFLAQLGKAPPVALSPALRQALRTHTARPAQLFMAAVHQPDAGVRVEARRAFLDAVEGNAALSATLRRADPNSIVPLVRSLPAERVDELFSDLWRRSRDPVLSGLFLRTKRALQHERAAQSAGPRS